MWPDHRHVQHCLYHVYVLWWAPSYSSALPSLLLPPRSVAHSSETHDPTAHTDPPAHDVPCTCSQILARWPTLQQRVWNFLPVQLLLLFHTGSSWCGSTLVFSDLRLNFLLTALASCLVLCDMKCLGALATKHVVPTPLQLALSAGGFLWSSTALRWSCGISDVMGATSVTRFGSLFLYRAHLWKCGSLLLPDKCR